MASIEKVMAGPSSNDHYNAASYYHDSGPAHLEQGTEWVQKATTKSKTVQEKRVIDFG